jgi:hypothetical protein
MTLIIAALTCSVAYLALYQSPMWAFLLPFVMFTWETSYE